MHNQFVTYRNAFYVVITKYLKVFLQKDSTTSTCVSVYGFECCNPVKINT